MKTLTQITLLLSLSLCSSHAACDYLFDFNGANLDSKLCVTNSGSSRYSYSLVGGRLVLHKTNGTESSYNYIEINTTFTLRGNFTATVNAVRVTLPDEASSGLVVWTGRNSFGQNINFSGMSAIGAWGSHTGPASVRIDDSAPEVTFKVHRTGTTIVCAYAHGTDSDFHTLLTFTHPGYDGDFHVGLFMSQYGGSEAQTSFDDLKIESDGPIITSQPRSAVGYWGSNASFSVTATCGTKPMNYQWQKSGVAITNATNSTLTLTNLQCTDGGLYNVLVSNSSATVASGNACLMVNPSGVGIALYAGITVTGLVGTVYHVQYTTNLTGTILTCGESCAAWTNCNDPNWLNLTTITQREPVQIWYDPWPANQLRRFYRVVPGTNCVP
jgi:hypothetical protein